MSEEIPPTTVIICSDSYSALTSILSGKSESRQDILLEVLQSLYRIRQLRIIVEFLWVPAHVGVEGNEEVDKIVKQALKHTEIDIHVPLSKTEIKCLIKIAVRKIWQERWDKGNKGRRDDTVISRLRIGHSSLKSLQMTGKHESGQCHHCGLPETVEHVLIHCRAYERERLQLKEEIKSVCINSVTLQFS